MINDLLLLSGNDIPFIQAQITIHQPKIKQIAYIGEENFYIGCEYLNFSKQNLNEQDKSRLNNLNDFEVLMTIMKNSDIVIKKNKTCMQLVLLLLFPECQINFLPNSIMITKEIQGKKENHLIDKDNFIQFKQILKNIFCLDGILKDAKNQYNPGGPQAKALVQKFKKRQKKLAELKKQKEKKQNVSILSKYISILSVGEKKDMNNLMQYTVYQLFDEFRRFQLKQQYDIYLQLKMAGAKDLDEITNWMSDIHS